MAFDEVAIFTAIKKWWDTDAVLLAASSLYRDKAPQSKIRPYTTVKIFDGVKSDTMSDQSNDSLIQFSSWSPNKMSAVEACDIRTLAQKRFDWADFPIPGQTLVWFKRIGQRTFEDPDGGYQSQSDYSVMTEET